MLCAMLLGWFIARRNVPGAITAAIAVALSTDWHHTALVAVVN